ncbi:MAG: TetR/AcrR family transcriptional regulator [Bdellovibrionales bacterium]|nr:TetR/AcrR family transcriptional regulator [Bdellovibrionales bacterium]
MSKEIFDSILQSSMLMINELGFDKLTTNKVAELAGVSIGSLYRYFPNRDAILFNLIKEFINVNHAFFINSLVSQKGKDMKTTITFMIETSLAHFLKKPKFFILLHQKMYETEAREIIFEARRSLSITFVDTIHDTFPNWNIEPKRDVLLEKVNQSIHSYMSALFAVLLENPSEETLSILKGGMVQLFILSIQKEH